MIKVVCLITDFILKCWFMLMIVFWRTIKNYTSRMNPSSPLLSGVACNILQPRKPRASSAMRSGSTCTAKMPPLSWSAGSWSLWNTSWSLGRGANTPGGPQNLDGWDSFCCFFLHGCWRSIIQQEIVLLLGVTFEGLKSHWRPMKHHRD